MIIKKFLPTLIEIKTESRSLYEKRFPNWQL